MFLVWVSGEATDYMFNFYPEHVLFLFSFDTTMPFEVNDIFFVCYFSEDSGSGDSGRLLNFILAQLILLLAAVLTFSNLDGQEVSMLSYCFEKFICGYAFYCNQTLVLNL